MKLITTLSIVAVAAALGGCIVAPPPRPRPVVVAPPPPVYAAPPGVVYVEPTYAIPAPGYVWQYNAHYGWGWRHPQYGWHRGWR